VPTLAGWPRYGRIRASHQEAVARIRFCIAESLSSSKGLPLGYLDYYRLVITRKLEGLTESELRTSRLPSGWTPLELVKHLAYMEQRWLRWGFHRRTDRVAARRP